ncbi:hypothetical protein ACYSNM_10570 [Myroides sp. LJL116]
MKRILPILLCLLSVITVAAPAMEWSTQKQVELFCSSQNISMTCCPSTAETSSMEALCCQSMSSARVSSTTMDRVITHNLNVPTQRKAEYLIKSKWFNSNYLLDTSSVITLVNTPNTQGKNGYKFYTIDRLDYLCVYRI